MGCSHARISLCSPKLKHTFSLQIRISWKRVIPTESWESMQNPNCEKQGLPRVDSVHDDGKHLLLWVPEWWEAQVGGRPLAGQAGKSLSRLSPGLEGGMAAFWGMTQARKACGEAAKMEPFPCRHHVLLSCISKTDGALAWFWWCVLSVGDLASQG